MDIIPRRVRDLFKDYFIKFSSKEEVDYQLMILNEAEDEEERKDLEELFQSTEDYYKTQEEIVRSGKNPAEFMFDYYMKQWDLEHPNASVEVRKQAIAEYEEIVANAAVIGLEQFEKDGKLSRTIEKSTRNCETEEIKDSIIQQIISEEDTSNEELETDSSMENNVDDNTIEELTYSDKR